jgi:hypothetical protein
MAVEKRRGDFDCHSGAEFPHRIGHTLGTPLHEDIMSWRRTRICGSSHRRTVSNMSAVDQLTLDIFRREPGRRRSAGRSARVPV